MIGSRLLTLAHAFTWCCRLFPLSGRDVLVSHEPVRCRCRSCTMLHDPFGDLAACPFLASFVRGAVPSSAQLPAFAGMPEQVRLRDLHVDVARHKPHGLDSIAHSRPSSGLRLVVDVGVTSDILG